MRTSNRIAIILALCLLADSSQALASVPARLTIQGKLTDPGGSPETGTYTFTFKIFDAAAGGSEIWPGGPGESQVVITDADGVWTAELGATAGLTDVVFASTERWLAVNVNDGVNPAEDLPRIKLNTNPYSYRLSTVDGASGGNITSKVSIGPSQVNTGAQAFVAGENNSATGDHSVVSGGRYNRASGDYSVVNGGGGASASDSNVASGLSSTVGGGRHNRARGDYSVVAGGGGGNVLDSNSALGFQSFVGGGMFNRALGTRTVVVGGGSNSAAGGECAVVGGSSNDADGSQNFVGGGFSNSTSASNSCIVGGASNSASGSFSFVGGGQRNRASGAHSVVVGGGGLSVPDSNSALGNNSTIVGGNSNIASGDFTAVLGGDNNAASGDSSTTLGGARNLAAGRLSIAAGWFAQAANTGAIVIAANAAALDVTDSTRSSKADQMVLRADGEFYFSNVPGPVPATSDFFNTSTGAVLTAGGTWTNASDRNVKENFEEVDREELLAKIAELPITRWNYTAEDDTVTHIGPVAQDFRELFGVGASDKTISTIDPSGIALAAIQALYRKTKEIDELRAELAELRRIVQETHK